MWLCTASIVSPYSACEPINVPRRGEPSVSSSPPASFPTQASSSLSRQPSGSISFHVVASRVFPASFFVTAMCERLQDQRAQSLTSEANLGQIVVSRLPGVRHLVVFIPTGFNLAHAAQHFVYMDKGLKARASNPVAMPSKA